jgi:hypothetical protein
LTASSNDRRIAKHDVLCSKSDRAKTRTTNLVKTPSSGFNREASRDVGLTCWVLTLPSGKNLTKDGLIHFAFFDSSARDNRFEHRSTQFMRRNIGKGTAKAAYCSPCGRRDYDIGHENPLL